MYLSDLRVYFKVEVFFRVTWSGMEELQNRTTNYANTNVEFVVDPKVFFPWLINVGRSISKRFCF